MKRIISVLITIVMIFTLAFQGSFASAISADKAYEAVGKTIYESTSKSPVYGTEWHILGLARSDYADCKETFAAYYNDVVKTLKAGKGSLSESKYTEYSRTITAVTAIGYDARSTGGYNMVSKLLDRTKVLRQGLNGPIWALIALNTGGYAAESKYKEIAAEYINDILDAEKQSGGWSLNKSETAADADITGMALTALAPYYNSDNRVKAAADRALLWLSQVQNDDGTYSSWGSKNSESCSQVITALTALGINPDEDARFIKNGKSVLDGLLSFYTDGGFKHIASEKKLNAMATEQGYYALCAYFRFISGRTSLYDMSDVTLTVVNPPAKTKITSVKSTSKRTAKLTWSRVGTATGYQIKYSSRKSMTGAKTATTTAVSKKITKLKSGTKYYFKVRAYRSFNGSRIYGSWSTAKSIRIK